MAGGICIRSLYTNILNSKKKCIRLEHRATSKNPYFYKPVLQSEDVSGHKGNVERICVYCFLYIQHTCSSKYYYFLLS
jgi:hypothetical protein